mmetsp:Transcript_9572/g.12463  ORF Transcript_9572/g.12463 Transcript_9572/m.12463 type:complete len:112 (-) Transcript_9572:252-587(-)
MQTESKMKQIHSKTIGSPRMQKILPEKYQPVPKEEAPIIQEFEKLLDFSSIDSIVMVGDNLKKAKMFAIRPKNGQKPFIFGFRSSIWAAIACDGLNSLLAEWKRGDVEKSS